MHQITVRDPGETARLADTEFDTLRESLKAARQASAVLLVVETDAWCATTETGGSVARAVELVYTVPVPVVCHISGRVTGAGLALALACDLRYADPASSWGFGDPSDAAGVGGGTSWLLRDRIGSALLDHLTWTGALLTAQQALTNYLISEVGDVSAAIVRAEQLATLSMTTASALKRGSRGGRAALLAEELAYEGWLHRAVEATR